MKQWTCLLLTTLLFFRSPGQNFINGDFELTTAVGDQINLSNPVFNSLMQSCSGFGTYGNLDIITSGVYAGGPQHGNWFIALTGGGTDMAALELTSFLTSGNSYTISFYDKSDPAFNTFPVEIGVSSSASNFGTLVYTTPWPALNSIWSKRTFAFTATGNEKFITVRQQGILASWVEVDNFFFQCPADPELGNDTALCDWESLMLDATFPNAEYLWQDNSTLPTYFVNQPGTYWVQVSTANCSVTDTIRVISRNCEVALSMPNVFTPNHDGLNDHFYPTEFSGIVQSTLRIYDRWGKLIAESNDLLTGWDGKCREDDCSPGTYFWMINYITVNNEAKMLKGYLTLIK